MKQPLGANLWIWDAPVTTESIRQRVPAVAETGFELVEIPLEDKDSWSPSEVRRIVEGAGLRACVCAAMGPDRDLSTTDDSVVRSTQEYLVACVEAAAAIGSAAVGGPLYTPTGQTGAISPVERSGLIGRIATNLQPVLDRARSTGVKLAIEPLNRFETSLFNTVGQTLELVKAVDHPACGVLLDTFHLNIEEPDIVAAFDSAGDRLVHVHACGNDRGAPGPGVIDWTGIAASLDRIGYDGPLVIESFTSDNTTLARAASIWRPLAPTQDDLARNGLAFLRTVFREQTQFTP